MWKRTRRAVFAAISAASLSVIGAVHMNPTEIGSNVSIYLRALGYTDQPNWLLSPKADDWAVLIALAVCLISTFAFIATFIRFPQESKDGAKQPLERNTASEKLNEVRFEIKIDVVCILRRAGLENDVASTGGFCIYLMLVSQTGRLPCGLA